jgi:hypothetical protein
MVKKNRIKRMNKKMYKTPLAAVVRVALETGIAADVAMSAKRIPMQVTLDTWDASETIIGDNAASEQGYVVFNP